MESKIQEVNGRKVEVLTGGEGKPLVFLHGGGIVEGFDCFEPLTRKFRFMAPHMPGFGKSDLDPAIDSREKLVAHTVEVIDSLGIDEFSLIGHSLGGWLASSIAASEGDRVVRLILAAPFGADVPEHPMPAIFDVTPEEERKMLTNDPGIWEGRVPDGPDPEFDAARAREGESVGRFMPGPFDPDLPGILKQIKRPTLILWGDDDRITPYGQAPFWASGIAGSTLETFPGVGHLLFHEKTSAIADVERFAA